MPYTDEFERLLGHYKRQYTDHSKAFTFAFEEAFKKGIKTFRDREPIFKKTNSYMRL